MPGTVQEMAKFRDWRKRRAAWHLKSLEKTYGVRFNPQVTLGSQGVISSGILVEIDVSSEDLDEETLDALLALFHEQAEADSALD
jgi:hypothetical protein